MKSLLKKVRPRLKSFTEQLEKWRWFILIFIGLSLLWVEIQEFLVLRILDQAFHYFEVFQYAVLLISTGLLIELFARSNRAHKQAVRILEYKHRLSLEFSSTDDWEALIRKLTELPSKMADGVDDVIVDAIIHRRGFVIDAPEQMKSAENNLSRFELATNRNDIQSYESDPIRAEINAVSLFIHAWALPKFVKLRPQAYQVYKKLVQRFPQIMKAEFKKAQTIKKAFMANDVFTLQGRTQVVISALELWPIDGRIYLAPLSAA